MNTAILLPTQVRHHCFASAKGLKRVVWTVIIFAGVMLAAESAHSQFILTPVPGVPNVASGSVAWATMTMTAGWTS